MAKDKDQRRDDLFTVDKLYEDVRKLKFITFVHIMETTPCGLSKAYQLAKLLKLKYPTEIKVKNMRITYDGGRQTE